jgi:predicted Holliday junction resolvase-like endonuclease
MFLGKGVDYVIFDGLYRGKLENIVFLEVKRGVSQLNKNEKMIKDAVVAGKLRYDVWRI